MTSIIIPCWNALALTRICLSQLCKWTGLPFELIIIDDASTDGTAAWLRAFRRRILDARPTALRGVVLLSNDRNCGYPYSMNRGIAQARGESLLFGNCDAAVTPRWLEGMRAALAAGPRIGGIAPYANLPTKRPALSRPWSSPPSYRGLASLERFASARLLGSRTSAYVPAQGFVPGFWFLTPSSAIDRVGGFDESFSPGGYEDWDLQWRLRKAGFELGFAGRSFVHHVWSGSLALNGVDRRRFFAKQKRRALYDKFPAASSVLLEVRGCEAQG